MAKWNKVILSDSKAELFQVTASSPTPLHLPNIITGSSLRALVVDNNGNVFKTSADIGTATLTLQNNYIYVGNGSNVATPVQVIGDASLVSGGTLTLTTESISNKTLDNTVSGTDTFLMNNGGASLVKTTAADIKTYMTDNGVLTTTLANNNILVGNGSGVATAVDVTGDIELANNGSTSIQTTAITGKDPKSSLVDDDAVLIYDSGTPSLKKTTLASIRTFSQSGSRTGSFTGSFTGSLSGSFTGSVRMTLPMGNIYIGSTDGIATPYPVTGDITINTTGSASIGAGRVTSTMLENNIINNFTSYAGTIPLASNSTFAISDGGSTKKITYAQLSGSLSSSFSSMGLFGGDKVGGPGDGIGDATNNAIARWDGTTGRLIKNSGVIIDDSNNITSINDITVSGISTLNGNTILGSDSSDTVTVNGITTFKGTSVTTFEGNARVNQNLTVDGDLTILGTTTTLNVENVIVEDKFILLSSGSTNSDGGFVVQQSAGGIGTVFGYDQSQGRFGVQTGFNPTGSLISPQAYVALIETGSVAPSAAPIFGGTTAVGTMHIDTVTGDIYIYS